MKVSFWLITPLTVALLLSSCVPTHLTETPTSIETQFPLPTPIHTTFTPVPLDTTTTTLTPSPTLRPSPTQTTTALPSPSLEPEQAREIIKTLLREPIDCAAPCFWGIVPGKTRLSEAKDILTHLGLDIKSTTLDNKDFHGFKYDFDSGLSIIATFTVIEEIVENLRIDIHPEKQEVGVQREWLTYSPETMIDRYGAPTKVDFFLGRAAPNPSYGLVFYFDTQDLIVEYFSYDLASNLEVCPLTDQIDGVNVWMGKNPVYPPLAGIPLEEATSMTMDEFFSLITGDTDNACIHLKEDMFPRSPNSSTTATGRGSRARWAG